MATADGSEASVIVHSLLPEGEPQGSFPIKITPNTTGQDLLRLVCNAARVPLSSSYVLQMRGQKEIRLDLPITVSNIQEGSVIYWRKQSEYQFSEGFRSFNALYFMSLLCFLIGIGGLSVILYQRFSVKSSSFSYGIVFDAGSSHTAMFIYKWDAAKINLTAVAEQDGKRCDVEGGGLSSYADNPAAAGASLEACLNFASQHIPSDQQGNTPVYLGATAGMRLLQYA